MIPEEVYDQPSDVSAEQGDVVVEGPDGVDVKLTPDAAVETSHRLLDAGLTAAGQRREGKPAEPPQESLSGPTGLHHSRAGWSAARREDNPSQ